MPSAGTLVRADQIGAGRTYDAALSKTKWGRQYQRQWALVDGEARLARANEYELAAIVDGRATTICGIGSLSDEPGHGGHGHAGALVDAVIARAAAAGAEMALLFGAVDPLPGFTPLPRTDQMLDVAESTRHGAPMTLVRGGEDRDLAAIAAMGRFRAHAFRFHLDRDIEFVQYAVMRKRLLAGLGPPHARQLHFFIAEEGVTAAAYVVLSVVDREWTLEECGDRDPGGARVGALLQALIAREPAERRPSIRAWLPAGFLPPQVTAVPISSAETILARPLQSRPMLPPLASDDVLFWKSDILAHDVL